MDQIQVVQTPKITQIFFQFNNGDAISTKHASNFGHQKFTHPKWALLKKSQVQHKGRHL